MLMHMQSAQAQHAVQVRIFVKKSSTTSHKYGFCGTHTRTHTHAHTHTDTHTHTHTTHTPIVRCFGFTVNGPKNLTGFRVSLVGNALEEQKVQGHEVKKEEMNPSTQLEHISAGLHSYTLSITSEDETLEGKAIKVYQRQITTLRRQGKWREQVSEKLERMEPWRQERT